MIASMTGFARLERSGPYGTLVCEIRSVNHRFLDATLRLPDSCRALEPELRQGLARELKRGKVDCSVQQRSPQAGAATLDIDHAALERLLARLRELGSVLTQHVQIDLIELLRWPGVLREDSADTDPSGAADLQVLYRTFSDLRQYCYRVASVVGLVCIRIFGYRDPAAEGLAESLGLAFQLTNIIRDIQEDAAMGRVYLPAEDIERFKIESADFRQSAIPERLRWLLAAEADRAREYYGSARELIPLIDEDSQPALWVLVTIYRRLLEKISDRKYDVFGKKISLTVREKVVILGKGLVKRLA